MKTLKQEEVDGRSYRDAEHAKREIGSFIEEVYNGRRLHSALAYRSPVEFEASLTSESDAMTPASRSLATAQWGGALARGLLGPAPSTTTTRACCAEGLGAHIMICP